MSDMIGRIQRVLLKPKDEFPKIASEPGDMKSLLMPYVMILAAIGPAMDFLSHGLIGVYVPPQTIFGMTVGGTFIRTPTLSLISAIIGYGVMIGIWWFYGFILAALAPSFGGRKDSQGGLKAATYSLTPLWVAGALGILGSVPYLGWLAAIAKLGAAVYSAILVIWAVPFLLGTPDDKKIGHGLASFAIVLVTALVAMFIVGMIVASIVMGAMGAGAIGGMR